jgi:hypothetical protein
LTRSSNPNRVGVRPRASDKLIATGKGKRKVKGCEIVKAKGGKKGK